MRAAALILVFGTLCAGQSFDYRKAARDAANNLDVQQSLPNDSTIADDSKEHAKGVESGSESSGGVPGLAAVWGRLKWVVLAIFVVAVLGFVASQVAERRDFARAVPATPSTVVPEGAPPSVEQLLAEADSCAGQGLYRDAMHYVLLAAMARVASRFRDGAPDSATSWELLRAAELRPSERTALRDLLTRTDRAWFGEYVSGVEDYQGARNCFHAFILTEPRILTDALPPASDADAILADARPPASDADAILTDARPPASDADAILTDARPPVSDADVIDTDARPPVSDADVIDTDARPPVSDADVIHTEPRPRGSGADGEPA